MKEKKATQLSAEELCTIGIFTAITAILAQVAIPLPFTPMPISCGLVAVYISGILLKPKSAVLTQMIYLMLGAIGLPVFGNFRGGLGALLGPTGGYLMVYPIMALIVSMALNCPKSKQAEQQHSKKWIYFKSTMAICIAHLILYLGGTTWLCLTTENSFRAGLAIAVYPFILLDIVKIVFCVGVIVPLRSRFLSMNLLKLDNRKDVSL